MQESLLHKFLNEHSDYELCRFLSAKILTTANLILFSDCCQNQTSDEADEADIGRVGRVAGRRC